jgi:peptide/nickel transport system permease protein
MAESYYKAHTKFLIKNLRKQWSIYYRSSYGKIGFYMLLFFLIISVISPLITFHSPEGFFAPQIDAYVASEQMAQTVFSPGTFNGTPYAPVASQLSSAGSYLIYLASPHGAIYGMGLGATPSTPAGRLFTFLNISLNSPARLYRPLVFPLANYAKFITSTTLSYDNYVLAVVTGNGTTALRLSKIAWSGGIPGAGNPYIEDNESLVLPDNTLSIASNSPSSSSPLPPWVPFNSAEAVSSGFNAGMLFLLLKNSTGTYLMALYDYPLKVIWSVPFNASNANMLFVGAYYSPGHLYQTRLITEAGSNITALNPFTGRVIWEQHNITSVNDNAGLYLPADYQLSYSGSQFVVISASNTLYGVYLSNGTYFTIFRTRSDIQTFATTQGSSGFPSSIIAVSTYHIYLISSPDHIYPNGKLPLPVASGTFSYTPVYDPDSETFILLTTRGSLFSVSAIAGKYPYLWHSSYRAGSIDSQLILVANAKSGGYSVSFTSNDGQVVLFSTLGVDRNPLPPTLKSPSGNVYLFGTNIYGQDLWSQWVASFPIDLEVGFAVAAGTIIISVLIAMIVGYLGGFIGSTLETISLIVFLIPFIPLVIVMASILGNKSLLNIILVFIVVGWPFTSFTLIGVVKSLRSRTFIEAAKVSGAGTLQILRRHMLSNMTPLLAYLTAINIGGAVGGISGLQVLGIGPVNIPTWGSMLNPFYSNFYLVAHAWWWVIPPTVTLTAFIFAFVFISRGLDEVVNPRLRRR